MKSLIVNADDLGWAEGVNQGIAEAFRHGIVTSTSLLANGEAFEEGVKAAKSAPGLGVGVHLNLNDGAPVADRESVMSLLNDDGDFAGGPESLLLKRARRGLVLAEVEEEWDAQIQRVRDSGIQPTHLDGHKHVHMLPGLFEIALRLAKNHAIGAIRIQFAGGAFFWREAARRGGDEARRAGARIETAGSRRPGTGRARRDLDRRFFLRDRANRGADARGRDAIAEEPAGRDHGTDVPPGLCGRDAGENGDAAAGFAANGAGDTDGHEDSKSCRVARDSPDRLWLRDPGSVKEHSAN